MSPRRSVNQKPLTFPVGLHNYLEIAREREYPFYENVVFLAIIPREERWLWKRKEF
jgi:hypothetical protein